MPSKEHTSNRRRSRPVEKISVSKKVKRNKYAMLLVVFIVLMLVFTGVYAIFTGLNLNEKNEISNTNEKSKLTNPIAVLNTSMGTIKIELYMDKAPITAGNFKDLAESGYYDGIIFHRVISNFMIQGGDPIGTGTGGHAAEYHEGYGNPNNQDSWVIPDEFHKDLSNVRGTISMANRGPNTGGSQFFINVVDNTHLDYNKEPLEYKHAVFGKVIDGMNIVDSISKVDTNPSNNKPYTDVVINSIIIE